MNQSDTNTPSRLNKYYLRVKTYGVWRTTRALLINGVKRFMGFDICLVAAGNDGLDPPCPSGYQMAMVDGPTFANMVDADEFEERRQAFENGDDCVVTTHNGQLVGYNFYSSKATRVNELLEFNLNDGWIYSYAAYTHPDHRGRRISPACWRFAKEWREAQGDFRPLIYYVSLTNLASLKSGSGTRNVIGYSGHWRWGKPGSTKSIHCFRTRGCRRANVGFSLRSLDTQ